MFSGVQAIAQTAVAFVAAACLAVVPVGIPETTITHGQRPVVSSQLAPGNSIGVRLLDVPAALQADPRARDYIIDNLLPGTTISRRIEVSNSTTAALRVTLYPAAATISDGVFVGSAGHTANDVSSWTTLSQGIMDVPAQTVVQDTVTIAVPIDADPGERYGVIWAEVASTDGGTVTQISRAGIRTYLSVGGANAPGPQFSVDSVTAQRSPTGQAVVQAQVHNTGGRALDMSGTLTLSKVSGTIKAGPYPVVVGTTLAPGQSEPVTIDISDPVENGPWDATISLQSGLLSHTYTAELTFPAMAGVSPAVAAHSNEASNHVVLIVLVSSALFLIVILLLHVRRKRKAAESIELT